MVFFEKKSAKRESWDTHTHTHIYIYTYLDVYVDVGFKMCAAKRHNVIFSDKFLKRNKREYIQNSLVRKFMRSFRPDHGQTLEGPIQV